mmetsp:Transcript_10399/g.15208  ORF Transcript_10399/g.15208 Transcript_10399/m.15208 type:complete len:113 (+) Transcript_10399:31-369(+)
MFKAISTIHRALFGPSSGHHFHGVSMKWLWKYGKTSTLVVGLSHFFLYFWVYGENFYYQFQARKFYRDYDKQIGELRPAFDATYKKGSHTIINRGEKPVFDVEWDSIRNNVF